MGQSSCQPAFSPLICMPCKVSPTKIVEKVKTQPLWRCKDLGLRAFPDVHCDGHDLVVSEMPGSAPWTAQHEGNIQKFDELMGDRFWDAPVDDRVNSRELLLQQPSEDTDNAERGTQTAVKTQLVFYVCCCAFIVLVWLGVFCGVLAIKETLQSTAASSARPQRPATVTRLASTTARPLTASEEGCDFVCSLEGETMTCKNHIQAAIQNRFVKHADACLLSFRYVSERCDGCSLCGVDALNCSERAETASSFPYRCEGGYLRWQQEAWSTEKKKWCCQHNGVGCPARGQMGG